MNLLVDDREHEIGLLSLARRGTVAGSSFHTEAAVRQDFPRLKTRVCECREEHVAAESGELRAARMRAQADENEGKAARLRAAAERIEKGNIGERRVAEVLDVLDGAGWTVLHDRRRSSRSPANIDHLVIGPAGVFVIDAKNWSGASLRLDERGMAYGRYRRDAELDGARADAARVRELAGTHDLRVLGLLAFVQDAGLSEPTEHQGVVLLQVGHLLPWLTEQPKVLTPQQVHQVASALDAALPPRSEPHPVDVMRSLAAARPGPVERRPAPPAPSGRPVPSAPRPREREAAQHAATRLAQLLRTVLVLVAVLVASAFLLAYAPPLLASVLEGVGPRLEQPAQPSTTDATGTGALAPPHRPHGEEGAPPGP